jgi:signal transduction histidine kinase
MSLTGIPQWINEPLPVPPGDAGHFAHSVQFYGEDNSLVDEVSRFVGTALVAGDAAVVVATQSHREAIAKRWEAMGFDIAKPSNQGRYVCLDASETLARLMKGNLPDATLFTEMVSGVMSRVSASTRSKGRIAVFGEMVTLLWAQGNKEGALRLEQLWNELAPEFPMSLRCAYPMSSFNREDHSDPFLKICSEHSHIIPLESYTALISDEQRLRSVTFLQQKAQALETEVAQRKQIEDALRTSKAELETQVEQRTLALRQLSSRLLSLQDSERRRIARELHDSLGQYLVGLKLNVYMLRQSPGRDELWSESEELMQRCIAEVRTLSYLLHPPTMDAAGFASAARWYVEGFGQRGGIEVALSVPEDLGRLADGVELALFRVLQEALTNVHRHAQASSAQVRIWKEAGQVGLEVVDDGCGIPQPSLEQFLATGIGMGVGLAGIRERARELGGNMEVESNGRGTMLRVTLPINDSN